MKIELSEEDIINEVKENFRNDIDFLYKLIDESINDWTPYGDLIILMIKDLKRNGESRKIDDIIDEIQRT